MKGSKKICALLLSVTMVAGMLAGCGKQEATETTQQGAAEAEQEVATNESEEREAFKLTVHSNASQGDWNNYWLIQTIEEKFNVDIQVEMISNDIFKDKLPLMFASDELPDMFLNSLESADITSYGSEGYLIDLSSYISEESTPNLWKAMQETEGLRASMTENDGKIYAINGADMQESNLGLNRFFINYDWAEKILGKQPETLDEFYEYLKGVKEQDMNGNGDATDEIPLGGIYSASEEINVMSPILNAFGFSRMSLEAIDGKVVYVPAEGNYKYFLDFMNKIYDEKLLDQEFFTQTQDQVNAKETNYLYGAYAYWASWVNQPDESIWHQYNFMEPLTSEYSDVQTTPAKEVNPCGKIMITKNCKNPEKLMEIVDWLFTFEGYLAVLAGPEKGSLEGQEEYGYEYEWMDKDTLLITDYYDEEKWETKNEWALAELFPDYGYFPIYRNFNVGAKEETPQSYLDNGLIDHLAPYYHVGWPVSIKYTPEETDELALISMDIQSYTDEMVTKMITGEVSTDDFESFVQGLKDRSLDRYLEIQQAAYDRWVAAN